MAANFRDPTDTPALRAEALKTVQALRALYPPRVIDQLKGHILKHVHTELKKAGLAAEAELLSNDLFTLQWFAKLAEVENVTEAQAHEFVRFFGPDGLQESVCKVLAVMADNGRLEAWI